MEFVKVGNFCSLAYVVFFTLFLGKYSYRLISFLSSFLEISLGNLLLLLSSGIAGAFFFSNHTLLIHFAGKVITLIILFSYLLLVIIPLRWNGYSHPGSRNNSNCLKIFKC